MTISEGKPPICNHCGEPKVWKKDVRKKNGGNWRCSVKTRETKRLYEQSPSIKAKRALWDKKYRATEQGKQKRREQQKRYVRTENGREVRKAYEETPKYYVSKRKYLLRKMKDRIVNQLEELNNG